MAVEKPDLSKVCIKYCFCILKDFKYISWCIKTVARVTVQYAILYSK